MFNDPSSLLSYLSTRRSCRPRDLVEPGPDEAQLRRILEIAARTPDHGKLFPWRFVHVSRDRRPAFAEMLHSAYRAGRAEAPARLEIEAVQRFATQAPELIVLISSPIQGHKIPVFEQAAGRPSGSPASSSWAPAGWSWRSGRDRCSIRWRGSGDEKSSPGFRGEDFLRP
jgi:nitroreductase